MAGTQGKEMLPKEQESASSYLACLTKAWMDDFDRPDAEL